MADQNITELPIKTNSGVASTDYMLGIDSAEGYQILVRDVAKYIVENYNGSSLLAGSTQPVKDAVNTLDDMSYRTLSDYNNKDIIPYITALRKGTYFVRIDNVVGFPITGGVVYRITKVNVVGDTRCSILAIPMNANSPDVYTAFVPQNATSITWEKMAKQDDVDALNSKKYELGATLGNFLNNNDDLNQFYTPGTFACKSNATASTLSNCPTTSAFKLIVEFVTGNGTPCQTIIEYNTGTRYYRYTTKVDGTGWSNWTKQPTRAEITELNSKLVKVTLTKTSDVSRGDGFLIYDPVKKSVRIYASYYNATAIPSNTVIFTIPSGYRPPANTSVPCFYQSTSGVFAYIAAVNANGNVVNNLGNTTLSGLIVGEYLLE